MNNNYLIPANTKDGQLILNWFKPLDLALVIIAVIEILTVLLITNNMGDVEWYVELLLTLPGWILLILVIKIPYYHNVRTLIYDIYSYYTNQHDFKWRGWYKDVSE